MNVPAARDIKPAIPAATTDPRLGADALDTAAAATTAVQTIAAPAMFTRDHDLGFAGT